MSSSTIWHSVSLPGERLSTVCISAACWLSIALLKSPEIVSVMSWCSASIPASGQPSSGGIFHTGLRWDGGSGQKMEELQSNSHRGNACDDVICHIHRPGKKKSQNKFQHQQNQSSLTEERRGTCFLKPQEEYHVLMTLMNQ